MGIRPWEIDLLTVEEFESAVAFVVAWNKAQEG
jgi:hypothetical protein